MIRRTSRVADLLRKEISHILLQELKDPRIGFVTVTGASVSDDLKYAKIFVSVMGDSEEVRRTFDGLKSATGFIQNCIARRINLRYTPEISFRLDTSVSYGAHIEQLLRDLKSERPQDSAENE